MAFERVYGLPCCHHIRDALAASEKWQIGECDIAPHWFYLRPAREGQPPPPIVDLPKPPQIHVLSTLAPESVRSSGRPRKDNRDKGTRRDPSHWEQAVQPSQNLQATQLSTTVQLQVTQQSSQRRPAAS